MRIGFFYQYTKPGSEKHLYIARNLLESVRKVMPGVQVIQLTDDVSEVLPDVDAIIRLGGAMPMAVRRMTHHSDLDGDWLFVDTDVVIQKDVSHVFDEQFDIVVTDRIGTEMEGTPYGLAMPYNMGVTFSRSTKFWKEARARLLKLPRSKQQWEGDQVVVCEMVDEGIYDAKVLPGLIYNYPPLPEDDDLSHASILHYKGGKKAFLSPVINYDEWPA